MERHEAGRKIPAGAHAAPARRSNESFEPTATSVDVRRETSGLFRLLAAAQFQR
jgi:hypothetical protein